MHVISIDADNAERGDEQGIEAERAEEKSAVAPGFSAVRAGFDELVEHHNEFLSFLAGADGSQGADSVVLDSAARFLVP